MTAGTLARFEGAALGYGRVTVLADVDIEIPRGAFVGVVGPNGSGKTTLLRALLGSLEPRSGRVERPPAGVRLGYVPQRLAIDPLLPLTLLDLVVQPLVAARGLFARPHSSDRERALAALAQVGLAERASTPFRSLSGGQQQRGLLARALALDPDLLVLDEPTNGMDLVAERAVLEQVASLQREAGRTVVFVTHLLGIVADFATHLVLVRGGGVHAGRRDEMLREETLTHVFGAPVRVAEIEGRTFVWAERGRSSER